MKKSKNRGDLILTIVIAAFFVIAVALFFLIPTINDANGGDLFGPAYKPGELFVEAAKAMISFNFRSIKYDLILGVGGVLGLFLIVWLVFIIIKRKPKKLILWGCATIMFAGVAVFTSAYTLVPARTIVGASGSKNVDQFVFRDILNKYSNITGKFKGADGKVIEVSAKDGGIPLFNNPVAWIFSMVAMLCMGFVGAVGMLLPLFSAYSMGSEGKVVEVPVEAKEAEEEVEEAPAAAPVETEEERLAREKAEAEERARQEHEDRLIAYVEYESGKPSREKEYEELCRKHGIPLPEDEEEAYYAELKKNLPVFDLDEVEDDEEYYREVKRHLGIFNEEPVNDDKYYEDVMAELARAKKPDDGKYYTDVMKELAKAEKKPEPVDDSKYYDDVMKELAKAKKPDDSKYYSDLIKELANAPKPEPVDENAYYRAVIRELGMFKEVEPEPVEDPEEYYKKVKKELPVLHEEVRLAKEESALAYRVRLAKELPCLHEEPKKEPVEEVESDEHYHERVRNELGMFKKAEPKDNSEAVEHLKRRTAINDGYYDRMKKDLKVFKKRSESDDE